MNKVINKDCVLGMKEMEKEFVDLVVTPPPYDNLRKYKGYDFNFEEIAQELVRVLKPGGVIVWVVGDATIKGSETGSSFKQALHFMSLGLNLHDTMIYEKNSMSMPDVNRYYQKFEYMFVFSKGKPKTVNLLRDRENKAKRWSKKFTTTNPDGTKVQRERSLEKDKYGVRFNIWKYNTGKGFTTKEKLTHPAPFPEKLAEDHILSWSNEGDLVLDPMAGSGTTGKMAVINNRKFKGFDVSEDYCKEANERIKRAQTQLKLF